MTSPVLAAKQLKQCPLWYFPLFAHMKFVFNARTAKVSRVISFLHSYQVLLNSIWPLSVSSKCDTILNWEEALPHNRICLFFAHVVNSEAPYRPGDINRLGDLITSGQLNVPS